MKQPINVQLSTKLSTEKEFIPVILECNKNSRTSALNTRITGLHTAICQKNKSVHQKKLFFNRTLRKRIEIIGLALFIAMPRFL
jgi:hypothetical protein